MHPNNLIVYENEEIKKKLDKVMKEATDTKDYSNIATLIMANLQYDQNRIISCLNGTLGITNESISKLIESNNSLSKSQNKHSWRIFWASTGLVLFAGMQLIFSIIMNWPYLYSTYLK